MNSNLNQAISYDWLMAHASNPDDGLARAFAGVIQAADKGEIQPPNLAMGLSKKKFLALLACYFPGVEGEICGDTDKDSYTDCAALPTDEFDDLLALLLEHRSDAADHTEWLAYAMASGCMGENHLYQDMGLVNRQTLNALLERYFPTLYLKNTGNMKWKKFFYKQLCERAEIKMCPAPSCNVCVDYHHCFATEEDELTQVVVTDSVI